MRGGEVPPAKGRGLKVYKPVCQLASQLSNQPVKKAEYNFFFTLVAVVATTAKGSSMKVKVVISKPLPKMLLSLLYCGRWKCGSLDQMLGKH